MEYFCNVIVPGLGKMFCPTKIFGCTVTINNYCTVSSPVPFSYHIIECGVDIHLSGRTGRAGRSGVSILFYKSQQEHMTPLMEKKVWCSVSEDWSPSTSGYRQDWGKGLYQVRHTQDVYMCITSSMYHCTLRWRPLPIIDDLLPFIFCYVPLACCSS